MSEAPPPQLETPAEVESYLRQIFGDNLVKQRELRGLTQVDLARRCNSSASLLSHYESKKNRRSARLPSLPVAYLIAQALEVSIDDLVGREFGPDQTPEGRIALQMRQLSLDDLEIVQGLIDILKRKRGRSCAS